MSSTCRKRQLSLIPFPTQRLFTQELKNFDLIIFENFSYQLYFPWYYLENVRKYVQEGGAFAMIGGALAFAQGGYAGTPIEDILPVSLRPDRHDYRAVTQRMVLTEEGKAHPITRLSPDGHENQRIWELFPELDALNVVGQAKPGATVLGVGTGRVDDRASMPLLAMQRFGEGRTLALMSDYIWKWNFQMAGRLDSNQYYLQFVRQMVRWLIRDPALKQVRIMADASEFPVGSEVTGTLQVLQDDYRPTETATLSTKLRTPGGTERASTVRTDEQSWRVPLPLSCRRGRHLRAGCAGPDRWKDARSQSLAPAGAASGRRKSTRGSQSQALTGYGGAHGRHLFCHPRPGTSLRGQFDGIFWWHPDL